MVDYMGAITRPFSNLRVAAIGTIVGAIPVLSLLLGGYALETAKKTLHKVRGLPSWKNNIMGIIVKTIVAIVIGVVYMIPAMVLFVIGGAAAVLAILGSIGTTADMTAAMTTLLTGGVFLTAGVVLAAIGAIFCSIGTIRYVKHNRIASAFSVAKILKKILTATYWISLVVLLVYAVILAVIAGILTAILLLVPFIGWLLMPLLWGLFAYAISVTAQTIFAQVYRETP